MPSLLHFQRDFEAAITDAEGAASRFSSPAFAVYRNTWRKALLDALGGNYPVVAALLGDEAFRTVALEFIATHPASTPVLADYGRAFANHLNRDPRSTLLPYLVDVARLERCVTGATLAGEAVALDPRTLSDMPPLDLLSSRPETHPSLRLAWFATPAVTIWRAHQEEGEFQEIEPDWRPEGALIIRNAGHVAVETVDASAHHFVARVLLGDALGEAAAATAELYPDADIPAIFALLITSGALVQPEREDG